MKIQGKHWDNIAELAAELKMVVPPPLPCNDTLGLLQLRGANYPPFSCGISFLIGHLLEPPYFTGTRDEVEAAKGEDGVRNAPSSSSYPIHHFSA